MHGAKRRAGSVRPDVAAAVGLCAHDDGSGGDYNALSERQRQRLDDIAMRLGIVVPTLGGTCAALAAALGDEWEEASGSADIFAAEEARAVGPSFVGSLHAPPLGIAWSDLPPEMQVPIVRDLVERDPRTAVALYATGPAGAQPFIGETHAAFAVDDQGALRQVNVPLVEYARLAAAFGETDPLDLFLASATCSLKALAGWYAPPGVIEPSAAPRSDTPSIAREPSAAVGAYVSALSGGLADEALENIPLQQLAWALGHSIPDPTMRDARLVMNGPLPGDAAHIARQWYEFVTTPSLQSDQFYAPTDAVGLRSLMMRVRPSAVTQNLAIAARRRGIPLGVFPQPFDADAFREMRLVGTVPPEGVRAWLLPYASDQPQEVEAFDAWLSGSRGARGAATAGLTDALRDRTAQDPTVLVDVVNAIGDIVQDYVPTSDGCAAYLPSSLVPRFAWLFAQSRAWLVRYKGQFQLFFQPRSAAIEEALAMAAARIE